MSLESMLEALSPEILDLAEEYFTVFSQSIPSQNLGFVDSSATVLDLTIRDRDLTIHQSPTILSSDRGGGTTGAVVWKITPYFASWITAPDNLLFKHGIVSPSSSILELGCGIAGIIGLSMAPFVKHYTLTDQAYVHKILDLNLAENKSESRASASRSRKSSAKSKKGAPTVENVAASTNAVSFKPLDWETDEVSCVTSESQTSFDVVIACDCIYNDALVQPLVQTSADLCKLRRDDPTQSNPTVCIVAQQLRSSEVFEDWLIAFHKLFRVWRLPDSYLTPELQTDSGFIIHIGILR